MRRRLRNFKGHYGTLETKFKQGINKAGLLKLGSPIYGNAQTEVLSDVLPAGRRKATWTYPLTAVPLEAGEKHQKGLHESFEGLGKLSAGDAPPFGFLHLPFELRLQIYHNLIPRKQVVGVRFPGFSEGRIFGLKSGVN